MKIILSITAILLGTLFLQAENPPISTIHRGRIQIQGPDMVNSPNKELSFSWTRCDPPDKQVNKEKALAELDKMWNELNKTQKKVGKNAYEKAKKYINNSPADGRPADSQSWGDKDDPSKRIDIAVITGKAFKD